MFGSLGVLLSDGEKLQCHECGRWIKGLGMHVVKTHFMSAAEYKEKFQLRFRTALLGEASREKLSDSVKKTMDLERLASIRPTEPTFGNGRKRRLESKLSERYQKAREYANRRMREGYREAREAGLIPVHTKQLNTPEAREKAHKTRMEDSRRQERNRKIAESLKAYYSKNPAKPKPPITEETRKRMSEAAKKRGISREAAEKIRAKNKARCALMTPEERKAMFKGRKL